MVAQYLLTFREVLEAALLSAIILAFLTKTGRGGLVRYAWYGIYGATAVSLGLGLAIWALFGRLDEGTQILFEGLAALIAVAVLTSMIYWMALKGRSLKREIESRVEAAVTHGAVLGLAATTFLLVFREGLETVLFLTPFFGQDVAGTLTGAAAGIIAGGALAYSVFRLGLKLDLRKFFYFTSVLLVLVAGGLLGLGVHEIVEYAEDVRGADFGWWGSAAFNLGLSGGNPDAGIPPDLFHERGAIGAIFAVLVGYDGNPEWARVIAHLSYLAVALPLVLLAYRKPEVFAQTIGRIRRMFHRERAPMPTPQKE